jgi:thiamine pyrophosphokinase
MFSRKGVNLPSMTSGADGMLLIGGEGPAAEILAPAVQTVRYVIAADSGFDLAVALGLEPDLLVGDMDSVARSPHYLAFPREKIRSYPEDKDETDTELGLRLFREMGYRRILLAGGGGGRLDHLVGILSLFCRPYAPVAWYTRREHIQVIGGGLEFSGWKGQTVSLFPLSARVTGLHSQGLKWKLDGLCWRRGEGGISNRFSADQGRITVGRGKLLMIRTFQEHPNV